MRSSQRIQRGLSLVELMIAVLLGALILAGTVMLFQQSRTSSAQDEQIARMQENGRFALRIVSRELSMVGYWGGMLELGDLTKVDLTQASAGSGDCIGSGWMLKFTPAAAHPAIRFSNDVTASPYAGCITDAEILDGTDVVAIKRVADMPEMRVNGAGAIVDDMGNAVAGDLKANAMYFKTNTAVGAFFEATNATDKGPAFVPDPNMIYQYHPAVLYVRPYSKEVGDGIPTLIRETLVEDDMVAQPLVEGVENFQIEFGVDGADADLSADFYTSSPTATELRNAVSARIYLLLRSIRPVAGYNNDKTYTLGNATVIAAPNDGFYRRVYSTTVQMRNADKLKLYALN